MRWRWLPIFFLLAAAVGFNLIFRLVADNNNNNNNNEEEEEQYQDDAITAFHFEKREVDQDKCAPPEVFDEPPTMDECMGFEEYRQHIVEAAKREGLGRKGVKALFWSDYFSYTHMMSRMFYHMYESARANPQWEAVLWGPGFQGHRQLCYCMDDDDEAKTTGEPFRDRIFQCSIPGDSGRKKPLRQMAEFVAENNISPSDIRGVNIAEGLCGGFRPLTFAEHLERLFNAVEEPFDMIIANRALRLRTWDGYFVGISNHTRIVFVDNEWTETNLRAVKMSGAHVVLHPYVDNFEENFTLREWASRSTQERDRGAQLLFADPVDDVEHSYAREINNGVLVGYAPYTVLPQCFSGWQGFLNETLASASEEKVDHKFLPSKYSEQPMSPVLLIGSLNEKMYPTRYLLSQAALYNSNVKRIVAKMRHPGWPHLTSHKKPGTECAKVLRSSRKQYTTFAEKMQNSKICFVGAVSTWEVRKYAEAMAAGCLVVGDVPADFALREFVVDLGITYPGYYNRLEDQNYRAVQSLVGDDIYIEPAEFASKPEHSVMLPNLYEVRGFNKTERRQENKLLAKRLTQILKEYDQGLHAERVAAARRYVMQQASADKFLDDWLLAAVDAHRAGERGWLRTPYYFREHGRKYETRHRYVQTEWVLRSEGLGSREAARDSRIADRRKKRMAALMGMPYEKLLEEAERQLEDENRKRCGMRVEGECERRRYYESISDFEIKFVAESKMYRSRQALDDYSHKARFMSELYHRTTVWRKSSSAFSGDRKKANQ